MAVHSGSGSAPRSTSLEQLGRGEIDILFAVDMFNEGVDVPSIGTVMMLRPTESVIIWLQQLGRGLRRVERKVLQVIDYIGTLRHIADCRASSHMKCPRSHRRLDGAQTGGQLSAARCGGFLTQGAVESTTFGALGRVGGSA